MQLRENPILDTDSYKFSHFRQFPEGTSRLFGYLESRGGRYGETLFFGLQYYLRRYLSQPITHEDVDEAKAFAAMHGEPFPEAGWRRVVDAHDGLVPLRIRAVPEGTIVPVRNALMTVESTDPQVPWLVGWFETQLMRLWYPITVATRSLYCKRVIFEALKESSDDPLGDLAFALHDFGSRGVSSRESAGIGGMSHLVNFQGTDTVEGARFAQHYYGTAKGVAGFSIPAMEHATVIAFGPKGEAAAFRQMLRAHPEYGTVACVSDSYDIHNAVDNLWGDSLLEEVKKSGKRVVIRPDSGDPEQVNVELLQILDRKLKLEENGKRYKVLPKYFRLIQGDGNDTEDDIARVLNALLDHRYSASNIAFGMGGGLLQKLDRDTQKFAFKLSEITVDGVRRSVAKNPKTDAGKASKAGHLDLVNRDGGFATVVVAPERLDGGLIAAPATAMRTFYENGVVFVSETLDSIRERAGREFR